MALVKQLTFESGAATGADAFDSTIGSSAIDTTTPILGSNSIRFTQNGAYGRVFFTASDSVSYAFYMRVDASPTTGTVSHVFSGGSGVLQIQVSADFKLKIFGSGADHPPLEVGKTYRIEVQFKNNADGTARQYLGYAEGNGPITTIVDGIPTSPTSQPSQVRVGHLMGYTFDEIYIRDDLATPTLPALPEPTGPATPTGLAATAVDQASISIAWDVVAEATSYDLRWSLDDADWTEIIGVTSPYSDVGLEPGTTYYYQVRSVNDDGTSDWSTSVSTTTDAAPEPTSATPSRVSLSVGISI